MLEKMSDFFENRLEGYDEHMMTEIESADEFYPFTAALVDMAFSKGLLNIRYSITVGMLAIVSAADMAPKLVENLP